MPRTIRQLKRDLRRAGAYLEREKAITKSGSIHSCLTTLSSYLAVTGTTPYGIKSSRFKS